MGLGQEDFRKSQGITEQCLVEFTIPVSYLDTSPGLCEGWSACGLNDILSFVLSQARRLRPSTVEQLARSCTTGVRIKTITETVLFSLSRSASLSSVSRASVSETARAHGARGVLL